MRHLVSFTQLNSVENSNKTWLRSIGSWTVYRQPVYRHPVYRQPVYRHVRFIDSRFIDTDGLSTAGLSTASLSTAGLSTASLSTAGLSTQTVYRHDRLIDNSIFIKDFWHSSDVFGSPHFEYERIFCRSQVVFGIIDYISHRPNINNAIYI